MDRPLLQNGNQRNGYNSLGSFTSNGKNSKSRPPIAVSALSSTDKKNLPIGIAASTQILVPDTGDSKIRYDSIYEKRDVAHPITNIEAAMHIMKGNIGTGILAIPQGVKHAGLVIGIGGLILIGIMCIHCMHLVLICARELCLRTKKPFLDYAGTVEEAFNTGPAKLRRFAKRATSFSNGIICIMQFGFCTVYLVFAVSNLKQVVDENFDKMSDAMTSYRYYVLALTLPLVVMTSVRNLKYLVPLSYIANVLQATSLVIVFYYMFQDIPDVRERNVWPTVSDLPLWFGTAVFAFEGICFVLPLENKMKRPQDFGSIFGVLSRSMTVVAALYVIVGAFGYIKYGEDIKESITQQLPEGEILATLVRTFYGFAIYMSYPLQFYIPVEIIFPFFKERISNPRYHVPAEYLFRYCLMIFTVGLSLITSQFGLLVSLVGAFCGGFMAIIFPAVLHLVVFWDVGMHPLSKFKDFLILVAGVAGVVLGTYTSILGIIEGFGEDS